VVFLFLIFCLSIKISHKELIEKVLIHYSSLLNLKTDWQSTFLEYLSKETERFFHTSFFSILSINNIDTVSNLISFSTGKASFLKGLVNDQEFSFMKKRKFFSVYKTNNIFDHKKEASIKKELIKYSFMVPVSFYDNNDDAYLCLYFNNIFLLIYAYFKLMLVRKVFSKKYAMILRNFYATFENLSGSLLIEIEDYVAISLNKDSKIIAWNKGADKLFGYRSFEIIGQHFDVLFNEDEAETFVNSLEVLAIKKEIKFFTILKDRMGIPIRAEITIKLCSDSFGKFLSYSIFIKDITKEEIFKENVQQHSFINYTILENSQDGILILDADDKIIFYNQRVRLILDNSMNLFGIPGKKIFPRRFGEEFEKAIETLKKTGQEFIDIDYCFERKYYNIRFFQVYKNTNSFKKSNHEYGGVIVFFIDESIRMMTLLELEEKKEALEKINANLLDALSSARMTQYNLVPMSLPSQKYFTCEAIYELSDDLGGDFYYVETITINDKDYGIIIVSDVSGHGISASMLNVMVKEIYGTYKEFLMIQQIIQPDVFLQTLNKKILELHIEDNKFITCFVAIVDFSEKIIKMSSAGHPLPYLITENEVVSLTFQKSIPTGVMDTMHCYTEEISYKHGDKFIFYTDGFLDLFEKSGFTPKESLDIYLNETKDKNIRDLKKDIVTKYKDYKSIYRTFSDDLTVIIVQF
ncbi:MAG: SpoIIE family protein phosphatase, partial [Brevinema sp.]